MGVRFHLIAHVFAGCDDGVIDEVAHDLFNVTSDIADFGELGRLNLEERRAGELGQSAADFGFTDTGGAYHEDILRINFVAQIVAQLLASPTVTKCNGNGAFGVVLADNETVKLRDNLAGG